jgi:DNA-binding SARP family transcriptional activator
VGSDLVVTLFGKFTVRYGSESLLVRTPSRAQEILVYLLLHRGRAHLRETLAEILWGERESEHVRKYLRQALWQLHVGLLPLGPKLASRLLNVEPDWVEIAEDDVVCLDVAAFERAFGEAHGSRGECLQAEQARSLSQAVQLYRGDLLEGWSQEWCLRERDRFRQMHLTILDKLMDYCEAQGEYDAGIAYGTLSLRGDPARERTHRSLMRFFALSGDRTAAIRQFERCCAALHEDLDVVPEDATLSLYIEIRNGKLGAVDAARSSSSAPESLRVIKKPSSTRR